MVRKRAFVGVVAAFSLLSLLLGGCASAVKQDLEAVESARDVAAQMLLQQAAVTATTYYAAQSNYEGFNAISAASYEPAVQWANAGKASINVVSIRGVDSTSLVLVTTDPAGNFYCLGLTESTTTTGSVDAQTAAECVA